MEIEVGEYVRTKNGVIAKVENIETYYADKVYWFDKVIYRDYEDGIEHLYDYKLEEYILKRSKNIIELIEEGDFVNGKQIECILETSIKVKDVAERILCFETDFPIEKGLRTYHNCDIKSIVTKEQFKNIEYRLE